MSPAFIVGKEKRTKKIKMNFLRLLIVLVNKARGSEKGFTNV